MADERYIVDESEEREVTLTECQIINYILSNESISIIKDNNLDESYFPGYREELLFILKHHAKYGRVPHLSTFLGEFPDFDLFDITESPEALVDKIREEKGHYLVSTLLVEANKRSRENSIEAAKYIKDNINLILSEINVLKHREGYDIFKRAHERAELYLKKLDMEGIIGCISNIKQLDQVTHGWLENDFISITARTQEGKSWIGEYLLLMPWLLQKKKAMLFSLENTKEIVGYRADTLLRHFSNDALLSGKFVLSWDEKGPGMTKNDYLAYIEEAKNFDVPFLVFDRSDTPLEKPFTIEMIEELITFHEPDIVLIDQLSLLAPHKPTRSIRETYVSITRYIREMVNRIHIPVILISQSGRESAKMAMKDKEATPELHQIAESDSVGQDSTRILSLRNLDGLLKMSLKKNTFGRSGVDIMMKWDIDRGILEELATEDADVRPEERF